MTGRRKQPVMIRCLLWGLVGATTLVSSLSASADYSLDLSARARAAGAEVGEEPGHGASVLFRMQLKSQWGRAWSGLLEVNHVETFFEDEHSDGQRLNGKPLLPDAAGTELSQLALRYRGDQSELTLGRQKIEFDDQRFVGSDSFWQQGQTFDAFLSQHRLFTGSHLNYAYINRARRIFASGRGEPEGGIVWNYEPGYLPGYRDWPYSVAGEHKHDTHLARLELNEWDYSQLVFHAYAIDNRDRPDMSSRTVGSRYRFTYRLHPMRYRVVLAAALQEQYQVPGRPAPAYYLAELAAGYKAWELLGRYEVLGSDEGAGFTTPLGSSYLFHGFAGVFAATPGRGLEDASIRVNWRAHPWELSARFHHFSAYSGNTRYGREGNIELQYKPAPKHQLMLRLAEFRAHADTDLLLDQRRAYLDYTYNF